MSLDSILTHAAFAPLPSLGWIKVTGSDRVRWLNGMVTNNIAGLKTGEGCYNFFLNAQGRIQGDATAWMLEDAILLETAADRIPALIELLDRFIIMDDVELAPIPGEREGLLMVGPQAETILERVGIPAAQTAELKLEPSGWKGDPFDLIHAYSPLLPCFEIWSDLTTILEISQALTREGAADATPEDLEQIRILSGTPLYGTDIRDRDLPQETNQTRALHFAKGCYLGQEIVERIRSRGAVHRAFTSFSLTGDLPPAGTALTAEGKAVGELTSVSAIELPSGAVQLALGYVRREALDRGLTLEYPGGTAQAGSPRLELTTEKV